MCPETGKAAKEHLRLVNDAVFFIPDMRGRIERLLTAHFRHQQLGRSAAYERETGKLDLAKPPETRTFKRAYFWGEHFPIQACLYVEHRARLYIMKALVDYWLARGRGEVEERKSGVLKVGNKLYLSMPSQLTNAMQNGLKKLSAAKSFRLFPVFWQVFLWGWGGFLMREELESEYAQLSNETGVPVDEVPLALTAFDEIFPTPGGWFREPDGEGRTVLILMPAAMRGIGAHRRKVEKGAKHYSDLKFGRSTVWRMAGDNDTLARLLECTEGDLIK